ncbi:ATP-binding protein [Deferribacter abyssi]|uniref:ATP-binding protein n=1 Tax=Deferribacter abyssi TaxID=213806 RepID=UPI003C1C658C
MIEEIIDQIELTFERIKNYIPERKRLFYNNIQIDNIRGALVYGLRGVGKTTFLIDKIVNSKRNFLYLSADTPIISSLPLYDIVSAIFKRGYDGVVIDEVHYANKWSVHVKALYDDYPGSTIWISDSSNIILKRGVADLSRRFVQFRIPLMSFREYLFLTQNILIDTVDFFNINKNLFRKLKNINILKLFNDYINTGIRPIFSEGEYCLRLKGLLEKSIYYDIPFYVSSIQDNHLRVINAIIGHLINAPVPTINISGMCSEWGLGKEKLYNLLYVMEQSELINIIRKPGKSVYTKGSKIFISDPSIYSCFKGNIGSVREAFVVMCLKEKFNNIFASKDEKDCDFIVDNFKIEVGGKNKKKKNADFVISDDIDVPVRNRIPLWILGLIY